MKKKLVLILLVLSGAIGYSQSLDCSKIKNGKFYNPEYPNKITLRKDNIQESYNDELLQLVWSVKWISECEFETVCTKSIGNVPIAVGDKIVTTITSIDGKCYTCKRTFYSKENPDGDVDPSSTFCIKTD